MHLVLSELTGLKEGMNSTHYVCEDNAALQRA